MEEKYKNTKEHIRSHFLFEPTQDQDRLMQVIANFLHSNEENTLMLIRGYAGTGKTSIIASLVRFFTSVKYNTVLLAPTGRAAKVMSKYAQHQASTIHRKIYFTDIIDGMFQFKMQENKHKNTFFILDEASMIADQNSGIGNDYFQQRNLLDDVFNYVYSGNNCRIIMVGDTAQLPPVGLEFSSALYAKHLESKFHCTLFEFELQEVVRQAEDSGILSNATTIRELIQKDQVRTDIFEDKNLKDFVRINGEELEECLNDSFLKNIEESIVITRSNKRANIFNKEIRNRILYKDDIICSGDLLMVVRNNYFWLPKTSKAGFIANGDIIEVLNIINIKELYGFRFAELRARLIDYPDEKDIELIVMIDTLDIETANLSFNKQKDLYYTIAEDYKDIPSRYLRHQKIMNNKYFNALQVKYSYAITCHKAQGGQWNHVYIDQGFLPPNGIDQQYLKWLYTAITRAKEKVFLVNFSTTLFKENQDS